MEVLLGFLGGIVTTLLGLKFADNLERKRARQRELDDVRYRIYLLLLELKGHYFWIQSKEMRGEEQLADVLHRAKDTVWRIADALREADELPQLPDLIRIAFSVRLGTASERAHLIDRLIDELGREVNPRYAAEVKAASDDNQTLPLPRRNDPGAPPASFD